FREVLTTKGGVDVLVNNAGLGGNGGVVEETSIDEFRTIMETNFFGALRCTKAVLPSMRERERGCIVNVTSQAGRLAMPSMPADCIAEAIVAEPPRLRWLVGRGAERNIRNRSAMTDAEWIDMWTKTSNEEFNARMFDDA